PAAPGGIDPLRAHAHQRRVRGPAAPARAAARAVLPPDRAVRAEVVRRALMPRGRLPELPRAGRGAAPGRHAAGSLGSVRGLGLAPEGRQWLAKGVSPWIRGPKRICL